jgi:aminobenzoyl-glutamate utilization protein B
MKKITSLCFLGLFLLSGFLQSQNLTKNKKQLLKSIERHKANLIEISDKIWSLAETAFEENASAKILADYAQGCCRNANCFCSDLWFWETCN